jgi:hypothetical protein
VLSENVAKPLDDFPNNVMIVEERFKTYCRCGEALSNLGSYCRRTAWAWGKIFYHPERQVHYIYNITFRKNSLLL